MTFFRSQLKKGNLLIFLVWFFIFNFLFKFKTGHHRTFFKKKIPVCLSWNQKERPVDYKERKHIVKSLSKFNKRKSFCINIWTNSWEQVTAVVKKKNKLPSFYFIHYKHFKFGPFKRLKTLLIMVHNVKYWYFVFCSCSCIPFISVILMFSLV